MDICIFFIILALIYINGLTDAPNAIATLVGTKVMPFDKARKMAAVCEVGGIIIMSFISISVAENISSMIDFSNPKLGLIGLGIGMLSTIIYSGIACIFGIPTSESHGLIAGITGSAIAIGGIEAINFGEWISVVIGLVWSIIGAVVFTSLIYLFFHKTIKNLKEKYQKKLQIISACGISFMHGAQDGLKFIGILVIYNSLISGGKVPLYIDLKENIVVIIICAITMALGVLKGGKNIVKTVGENMTELNNELALCSDFATIITLMFASLIGMPVSTTHAKTLSILMVGKLGRVKSDGKTVGDIVKAWVMTFPICGGIAYVLMKIIMCFI